jgi:hypothetical protein
MIHPWLRIAIEAWFLGVEASNVVALRLIKLALGGPRAKVESSRMIEEKLAALVTLQWQLMMGGLGVTPLQITRGSLGHYKRAVRRNRSRLSRPRRRQQ